MKMASQTLGNKTPLLLVAIVAIVAVVGLIWYGNFSFSGNDDNFDGEATAIKFGDPKPPQNSCSTQCACEGTDGVCSVEAYEKCVKDCEGARKKAPATIAPPR